MPHPAPNQILSQQDRGSCCGPNSGAFMPAGKPLGNSTCSWFIPTCLLSLTQAKEQNPVTGAVGDEQCQTGHQYKCIRMETSCKTAIRGENVIHLKTHLPLYFIYKTNNSRSFPWHQ